MEQSEAMTKTPLDQVKALFETDVMHSREEGQQIKQLLLDGRTVEDLNAEELYFLSRAYNWTGEHQKDLECSVLRARKFPEVLDLLGLKVTVRNCAVEMAHADPERHRRIETPIHRADIDPALNAAFTRAQQQLHQSLKDVLPPAQLKCMDAEVLLEQAIPDGNCPFRIWDVEDFPLGQWERWDLNNILFDRAALLEAAKCLAEAVRLDPDMPQKHEEGGGMWDFDFAPVFALPEYRHLALYTQSSSRQHGGMKHEQE